MTLTDPNVFTRPWKMSMVLYRQLEDNAALVDFRCFEFVEETFLGHLRKNRSSNTGRATRSSST